MKHPLSSRRVVLMAAMVWMTQHGAVALADGASGTTGATPGGPVAGAMTQPSSGAVAADPAADVATDAATNASQGDVAELMRLLAQNKLVELRTTYNGSYGTSLLFEPQEMTYYVTLFRDKHFWRVIKSQDDARAQMIYANFVQKTAQLADVEIRRTQLQAQNDFLSRVLSVSQDRAQRLQADLDVAHAQQSKVDDQQRVLQAQAVALRQQKQQAQAQLRDVQREVQQLQRQTEAGLPPAR